MNHNIKHLDHILQLMKVLSKVAIFCGFILLVMLICPMVTAISQAEQYYNEGVNYINLGQYSDALASFDKVIAINPNDSVAWSNRGVALRNLGLYTEAVASYDKSLAINPNFAEAKQNRINALEKQSQAQPTSATPIKTQQQTQQQTKTTPLLYAPIGAIVLVAGIAVWGRRRYSPL